MRVLSNDLMFLQPRLTPWYDWSGLVRVPIFWEDDVHCVYFERQFSLDLLQLERPGLKVLNFHPVHLSLNTRDLREYRQAKDDLARGQGAPGPGVRTLFEALASQVAPDELATLGEIAARFTQEHEYVGHSAQELDGGAD